MTPRSVLVLSPDPYLAFLLERHPDGPEVTVGDDQMRISSIVAAGTDLVVCEYDDPRLGELSEALGDRLMVVGPPSTGPEREDGVLHRPLTADEVQRAIDQPARERRVDLTDPIGRLASVYPWALVAAGLIAALVLHLRPEPWSMIAVGYAVAGYGLARTQLRAPWWVGADFAVAVAAAVAADGMRGGFVVLSLVVATGAGLHLPTALVLPATLVLGGANAWGAEIGITAGIDLPEAIQTVVAFPLVGHLALAGARRASSARGVQEAERMGQLLRELRTLTGSEPDVLRLSEVIRSGLQDVCAVSEASAGVLLLHRDDGLYVAGVQNVAVHVGTEVDWSGVDLPSDASVPISREDLPDELDALAQVATPCTAVALRGHHGTEGMVVMAGTVRRSTRTEVLDAADRVGTSIANARLFARLRTDTVDEERRRLAGELHDSTAQVLAHIRLELELLARQDAGRRDDLLRLARVTQRAQEDIRQVINGLRANVEDRGLAGSLRAYVADLRSASSPLLGFSGRMHHYHPPEVEREVFRIAQEAISNAVRHAGASRIDVAVSSDEAGIVLTVEDDGRGLGQTTEPAQGLGLRQMRERATTLGGTLDVMSSASGTRIALQVPVHARWSTRRAPHLERSVDA